MGGLANPTPHPLRLHFGSAPDNLKASQPSVARATVLGKAVGTHEKLEVSGCHSKGRRKAKTLAVISSPGRPPPRAPLRPSQPSAWSAPRPPAGAGFQGRVPPPARWATSSATAAPPPGAGPRAGPGRHHAEPARGTAAGGRGGGEPGPGAGQRGGRGPGAGWVRPLGQGPSPGPTLLPGPLSPGRVPSPRRPGAPSSGILSRLTA